METKRGILALVTLVAIDPFFGNVVFAQVSRGDRYSGETWVTRSPVIAQHGMAATEQPLASATAIEILKKGGSAVDAAVAANAVIGVMQPVLNGIGGDLFAIVWDPATHQLYGYNGSGPAARSRSLEK
ncbi:Gamma-glutamyltransferase (fragment) [Verrucomicrobia bacterium]